MPLQVGDLRVAALGVEGDVQQTPLQEVVHDGIHLRWSFSAGFPWHGYYLFRRPSRGAKPVCMSRRARGLETGPQSGTTFNGGVVMLVSHADDARIKLRHLYPKR